MGWRYELFVTVFSMAVGIGIGFMWGWLTAMKRH
jgi:hypothetical protein